MGSDALVKESNSGPQGCFWRNLKWGLAAMTSVVLIGRILLAPTVKNTTPKVSAVAVTNTPEPVLLRPSSTDAKYDPYFVSLAKDFPMNSDFDVSNILRKKGFRVTKDQAMQALRDKTRSSPTQKFLESHTDWLRANWASLDISQVPLAYATTVMKDSDGITDFPDHDELMNKIDEMHNHEFFLEIAKVSSTGAKVTGGQKFFFVYDEASWKKDSLTATKFMGFLEIFTGRMFHGAFMKELTPWMQTDMRPIMPIEEDSGGSISQSFALMPNIKVPKALKDKCHSAAGNNITESLDEPLELKILVLWGKAYMATCYSAICNPFARRHGVGLHALPRYVIYPEGSSKSFQGMPKWKGEMECANAVDSHIKSRIAGAFEVAEAAATGVGAPWIRADVFLDDTAKHGAYLHRLRDATTSSSGWDQHSDRAMAIVARGFEARNKIAAPKGVKGTPPTRTPEDVLKSLSCEFSTGEAVTCQAPKEQKPSETMPQEQQPSEQMP